MPGSLCQNASQNWVRWDNLREELLSRDRPMPKWCHACHKSVDPIASSDGPNHVLHFVLTMISCGLWLPIWILVAIGANVKDVCPLCQNRLRATNKEKQREASND